MFSLRQIHSPFTVKVDPNWYFAEVGEPDHKPQHFHVVNQVYLPQSHKSTTNHKAVLCNKCAARLEHHMFQDRWNHLHPRTKTCFPKMERFYSTMEYTCGDWFDIIHMFTTSFALEIFCGILEIKVCRISIFGVIIYGISTIDNLSWYPFKPKRVLYWCSR